MNNDNRMIRRITGAAIGLTIALGLTYAIFGPEAYAIVAKFATIAGLLTCATLAYMNLQGPVERS